MRRGGELKWRILRFLGGVWFIPLVILILVMSFYVTERIEEQSKRTIITSMSSASDQSISALESCIQRSKNASYLPGIREAWEAYEKDNNRGKLYSSVSLFLSEQYKFEENFPLTVLYFTQDPSQIFYTGDESAIGDQHRIDYYEENVHEKVREISTDLDTRVFFLADGGRVYMIRNILSRDFKPYAVIIMELNEDMIFGSLRSVWEYDGMRIYCGDQMLWRAGGESKETGETEQTRRQEIALAFADVGNDETFLHRIDQSRYVMHKEKVGDNIFTFAVSYNPQAVTIEQRSLFMVFIILLIMMIPLAIGVFHFFNKHITQPIQALVDSSREIADGHYGVTVPENKRDGEIDNLTRNFNQMSRKLDEQFNKIYVEEIALRDANIHALQSQINPHFLNNTLEIINWEARMNGDEKASGMIEALSTMMNATMNRDKRPEITLSEELEYAHAYRYIIQCRCGDRFTYEENIDESLLSVMVPRLIIQPVLENAVEHGTDERGRCDVRLEVKGSYEDLTIRIINRGEPKESDWERIRILLSDEESKEKHAVGIGIRNVHKRLQIMYEEGSGLAFTAEDGCTVGTIRVLRKNREEE